jgi:hypothetical protein
LVTIALHSALRLRKLPIHGRITATDLGTSQPATRAYLAESALPLMRENLALNGSLSHGSALTCEAAVLDWDQPLPDWVSGDEPSGASIEIDHTAKWPDLIMCVIPSILRLGAEGPEPQT